MAEGDFIEVFIDTSLEECEKRDPKGLYAKARKGEIPQFTGISAPYEAPEKPELIVTTENKTKQQSAEEILTYLKEKGYLGK